MTKFSIILPDKITPGTATGHPAAMTAVLHVLAYFDIFRYPLTSAEIKQFAGMDIAEPVLADTLQTLTREGKIFRLLDCYSLQDNPLLVYQRRQGNERAKQLLQKAIRIGRFLYRFPFVSAVGISGSLSKNVADVNADIDFFIITRSNRLWTARTLMHLFKKLTFLTGHQHYYCMNYYVDEQALSLPDRNIFTAIEIKTLLPVSGEKSMQAFFMANQWANDWLPKCNWRPQTHPDKGSALLKRTLEWILGGKAGNKLNHFLWKITDRRWKKKEARKQHNKKGLPMGLVTGLHFAKSNAGDFQGKVLACYEQKVQML
ncbi:MAG: hypothetical protein NTW29_17505 [Bacteroidetes bacterium]|nr:hypothetical protein [Bacteroidota bacterium]